MSATLIREIGILRELMIYHHPNIVNVRFIPEFELLGDRCIST